MPSEIMKKRFNFLLFCFLVSLSPPKVFAETQVLDYIKIIVNDEILTNNEVQATLDAMQSQILQSTPEGRAQEAQLERLEAATLENLVNELLILDRANTLKIAVTEDEVEKQISYLAERNPQITTIYDPEQLKELVSKDLLKQRVVRREVSANVRVLEEEITAFCEEALEETKQVEIAQILFRGSEEEAQKKQELVKQALQQGADFAELAKTYSEDPSAQQNGGKLGSFQKGQLLPAIDAVAFSLKKEELSPLVKTDFGFHLLYLHAINYQDQCDALSSEQHTQYHNQVFDEKHQESLKTYLAKLKQSAQVVIY